MQPATLSVSVGNCLFVSFSGTGPERRYEIILIIDKARAPNHQYRIDWQCDHNGHALCNNNSFPNQQSLTFAGWYVPLARPDMRALPPGRWNLLFHRIQENLGRMQRPNASPIKYLVPATHTRGCYQ